jgi:hypothetical protein
MSETNLDAKLLATEEVANTMSLRGYVGPTTTEGRVTLYPRINDLSESLEIAGGDILHSTDVSESFLPYGAKIIWVKKDANIIHRRGETIGNVKDPETKANLVEVRKGRLHIQIRSMPAAQCNSCFSCQNCLRCVSRCNTCQSHCRPE